MTMKVKTNLGALQVEAEGETMVKTFEQLGQLTEIFGHCSECFLCKNKVLRYRVRKNKKKQKFFEVYCTKKECKAVFRFGVTGDDAPGELFPQRKFGSGANKGKYKPNEGWEKYDPKAKE